MNIYENTEKTTFFHLVMQVQLILKIKNKMITPASHHNLKEIRMSEQTSETITKQATNVDLNPNIDENEKQPLEQNLQVQSIRSKWIIFTLKLYLSSIC